MTTYDQYAYDEPMPTQQQAAPIETEDNQPGRALNASQKKAIAAALVGTAALGGAAYGLSLLEDGDGDGSGNLADGSDSNGNGADDASAHAVATVIPASFVGTGTGTGSDVAVIDGEPRLATTVTDDMTFDEAFAAARAEMGPGDYFEWHGNYYNTFYQHEWEGMSETEHQAFVASLGDIVMPEGVEPLVAHSALDEPVSQHQSASHHTASAHHAPAHHAPAHHAPVAAVAAETAPAEEPKDANVSVIDAIAGSDSNVTVMHVDGHAVSLIDTNHDQQTDMTLADNNVVLVDTDKDHKLDSQGAYNTGTHQLEGLHPLAEPIGAPDMEADDRLLPADYEQLYTNNDLGHGHDLHGAVGPTDLGN